MIVRVDISLVNDKKDSNVKRLNEIRSLLLQKVYYETIFSDDAYGVMLHELYV